MSGRSSRPIDLSKRIRQDGVDPKLERKLVLQQLHDAAQIGDVETVKYIFDTFKEVHINITRKGRNTTLHTAVLHNQEGPLIDYLINNGADVNIENSKGYSPITLAIIHCKGSKAAEKLIASGAKWEMFDSGAFQGQSAMDVAIKYQNENVITLLKYLLEKGDNNVCMEVTQNEHKKGWSMCPTCNLLVKFPTKMSRIEDDQKAIEERIHNNGEYTVGGGKNKHRKYISRKYMDQLLSHSDGEAYKKLCGIEYHQVENMRLRKEISESYAVLHAVQDCCINLGISKATTNDNIYLENIFLIDLCSGKGITTALCGALDNNESNNFSLAIDRMLPHTIPHFLNEKQVQYLCRDIMAEDMFEEISDIVQKQTQEEGRTCILVGMHLCGLLSERAIDLFQQIPDIKGLVLSPCCLPKKHEQRKSKFSKGRPENSDESIDLFNYFKWSNYLKERVEGHYSSGGVEDVKMYTDDEMHTEKNAIIVGIRK